MKAFALVAWSTAAFVLGVGMGGEKPGQQISRSSPTAPGTESRPDSNAADREAFQLMSKAEQRLSRLLAASKGPGRLQQRHEQHEILRDITAAEIAELIARAEKLPLIHRRSVLFALVERWMELDAAGARSWITSHPVDSPILLAWARVDPRGALEDAFQGRGGRRWTTEAITAAIEALAGPNLSDQVASLAELPPGVLRDKTLNERIAKWAETSPESAFRFANALPPGRLRDMSLEQVLLKWAGSDPAAAVAQVQQLIPELSAGVVGHRLLTQMADAIARRDPAAALKFATELPPEFQSNPAIAAARAWAKTDAVAALEWCQENGIDVTRGLRTGLGGWTGAVLKEAMLNQPAATVAWIEALPAGPNRDRLAERALLERLRNLPAAKLFENENEYILQLFHQLPPESQPRPAASIGEALASRPGFADLRTITSQFSDPASQMSAVTGALQNLASQDLEEAERVFSQFTSDLPPGPVYDAALSGIARGMRGNPAEGLTRALAIGDPTLQRTTMDSIVKGWIQSNPKAATQWLAETKSVSPEWVQKWQARATPKR